MPSLPERPVGRVAVHGFLTVLGYSLYDTVVVFDKVRENTAGQSTGECTRGSGSA